MLGEALAMARAKESAEWSRAAMITATIVNRSLGERERPVDPDDLNPYIERRRRMSPADFVHAMKGSFPSVKRGSPEHKALLCRTSD